MAKLKLTSESARDRALAKDFRNFLFAVWKFLGLPEPTPVQYEIAHLLQTGGNRLMIQAYRGCGKSWITSAFVLWVLRYHDVDHKFEVVSASKQRADAFTIFTRRLIAEMPELMCLQPGDNDRDSSLNFDVQGTRPAHAPSVKSVGISGQLTGSRANTIIADDIEVPSNSWTQEQREKLEKLAKEFSAIIVPGGRIIYLGTPQTDQSTYNTLPRRGFDVYHWPAQVPNPEVYKNYLGKLSPSIQEAFDAGRYDEATDPKRFNMAELDERRKDYGRAGYMLQFMLDTSLSDAERYPLRLSDLVVLDLNTLKGPTSLSYGSSVDLMRKDIPNIGFNGDRCYRPLFVDSVWAPYTGSIMAVDPSGRGKDETAWAIVKVLNGNLFLVDAGGFKGGYEEDTLFRLAQKAKEHSVNKVLVESNFGDGMFTAILRPVLTRVYPCNIEEVRHHTRKEQRICDVLEPVMGRHRLVVDAGLLLRDITEAMHNDSLTYSLAYQLTHITRDVGALTHDDRLEVVAMAVSAWMDTMAIDTQSAKRAYDEQALDAQLMEFCNGFKPIGGFLKKTGALINRNIILRHGK